MVGSGGVKDIAVRLGVDRPAQRVATASGTAVRNAGRSTAGGGNGEQPRFGWRGAELAPVLVTVSPTIDGRRNSFHHDACHECLSVV